MGLTYDAERARRYELIWKFLISNEGRNPKVPDIDQIVPLPPARLPPWDGTFQWQKEQDAAVPPPKPSDELIERLSKAKSLDPATGLPLPGTKAQLRNRSRRKRSLHGSRSACPDGCRWAQ